MASSKVFLQSFILIAVCITSLQGMGDVKNIYTSVSNMMGTIKSVKNHYVRQQFSKHYYHYFYDHHCFIPCVIITRPNNVVKIP